MKMDDDTKKALDPKNAIAWATRWWEAESSHEKSVADYIILQAGTVSDIASEINSKAKQGYQLITTNFGNGNYFATMKRETNG